jgi:hypothetical protein
LFVVILDNSVQISLFGLDLLVVRKGVQWLHDVLYLGGEHFGPFFLTRRHFPLLGWTGALFDSQKLSLGQLHALLERLSLHSLILGKLRIEFFRHHRRIKLDHKEGLILQLEQMGGVGLLSEILGEVLVAGLGVEVFLDAPDAELVSGALPHYLPLQLL